MVTLICALVESLPIGTNLGMLHLLWMLVSGQVLAARGAVIPGLSACGLSERAVRRAWAALGQGDRAISPLLARWQWQVLAEGQWQPQTQGGDHPVAVDMTAFWRPRLQNCPTTHDHALGGQGAAGHPRRSDRAGGSGGQPASGLAAGFRACGHSGPQRQRRAPPRRVRVAVAQCAPTDALVLDAGFSVALLPRGRSHPLCGASGQEQHGPPRHPAGLSGPRPPAYARGTGPSVDPQLHKGRTIPATPMLAGSLIRP